MNNIHPTAVIYPNVELGDNVYIGAFSVIGAPPEHRGHWDAPYHGVVIGDNVRITTHVTIDAGTNGHTIILDNCVFLSKSHVGHDVVCGKGVTVSCGARIGGHAVIGNGVNIGLNATIIQHKRVPDGVMIGMGGVVTKSLKMEPFMTYAGNPAKLLGANTRHPDYLIYMEQMYTHE